MATPVMVVHGGAWTIPDQLTEDSARGVRAAVRAGYEVLGRGGTALDAIQAAVCVLEDDPSFDAGKFESQPSCHGVSLYLVVV